MAQQAKLDATLARKHDMLCDSLCQFNRLAVAFSGGVDSTLLLKVAHNVLGHDVVAITGKSPSIPAREIAEASAFCKAEGIEHAIVETREFMIEGFDRNPPDRCYYCKRELLTCVREAAASRSIDVIAEGSNVDDEGDFRPGFRAVKEMHVISPLRDAGMGKDDIRALAKHLGLVVWDKPAFACLNTRFAYGDLITEEKLGMVDRAEDVLRNLGLLQVRVRVNGDSSRIEVPADDIERLTKAEVRNRIVDEFKRIGFTYISLDLQGYRTGSMNETL